MLTAALAEAAGATLSDTEFVALMLYSAMGGGDTCVVGGWCAKEDAGSSLREELLVLCQEYARSRSGQDEDSSRILKKLPSKRKGEKEGKLAVPGHVSLEYA